MMVDEAVGVDVPVAMGVREGVEDEGAGVDGVPRSRSPMFGKSRICSSQ